MSVLESGIMETVAAADSNISSQAPAFLPETTHAPYCSIFSTMQPYSEVYGAATSSSFPIYQPIPPTNYASDCTAYTSMSQTNCLQSYPAYMPSCPDYIPFCTDHSNTYAFPNMECSNFKVICILQYAIARNVYYNLLISATIAALWWMASKKVGSVLFFIPTFYNWSSFNFMPMRFFFSVVSPGRGVTSWRLSNTKEINQRSYLQQQLNIKDTLSMGRFSYIIKFFSVKNSY